MKNMLVPASLAVLTAGLLAGCSGSDFESGIAVSRLAPFAHQVSDGYAAANPGNVGAEAAYDAAVTSLVQGVATPVPNPFTIQGSGRVLTLSHSPDYTKASISSSGDCLVWDLPTTVQQAQDATYSDAYPGVAVNGACEPQG